MESKIVGLRGLDKCCERTTRALLQPRGSQRWPGEGQNGQCVGRMGRRGKSSSESDNKRQMLIYQDTVILSGIYSDDTVNTTFP